MRVFCGSLLLALALINTRGAAAATEDQLAFVPLTQPCRLLDSRTAQGGVGAFTAAHGNYKIGTSDADIESFGQNGNSAGCGLPPYARAISVSINQLNATAAGNIRAWSTDQGTTGPAAGSAVYNPTVSAPTAGQVVYNPGSLVISLGADHDFYLAVANGSVDLTINVIGYWHAIGTANESTGTQSVTIGSNNGAYGEVSIALGNANYVSAKNGLGIGAQNTTIGERSLAIGAANYVAGPNSIALGSQNHTDANATGSIVMGTLAYSGYLASFVFGDGLTETDATSSFQFLARAEGGFVFYTGPDKVTGTQLAAGSGSWTALSDRNAKMALRPIDSRDVLDRVVAMPLATWQYKTQDAKYRHMGPMAQDFYAAFGLGESDTGIDTIDADGVALAAIQGLNAKLEQKDQVIEAHEREIAELRAQVADLAAAIRHPVNAALP